MSDLEDIENEEVKVVLLRDEIGDPRPNIQEAMEKEEPPLQVKKNQWGQKKQNIFVLVGLNSFSFAYGLIVSTMGLIVLPEEALSMFLNEHSVRRNEQTEKIKTNQKQTKKKKKNSKHFFFSLFRR